MADIRIVCCDGSPAVATQVAISFGDGSSIKEKTDSKGFIRFDSPQTQGTIYVQGIKVHTGNLELDDVLFKWRQ